jgi:K(+)-stimulated pyrophosphate-energized sodium pump
MQSKRSETYHRAELGLSRDENVQSVAAFRFLAVCAALATWLLAPLAALASEANLVMPKLDVEFTILGSTYAGTSILWSGVVVGVLGIAFGLYEYLKIKGLPAHKTMLDVSELIYSTCRTYLLQQGKFLAILQILIGIAIVYYFLGLVGFEFGRVLLILFWSVLGILGSFGVAWFGIRINNYANSRTAFASLAGKPYPVMDIPLRAGMSIGVVLICVELLLMLAILLLVPRELAGACFIGFAIGESLGASALRICGGIFTKIADIASDLMKIVFNIKEDDARNPGVIADCAGDNAGDSVGPTADGFETYGVTGVALITFIILAVGTQFDPSSGKYVADAGGEMMQATLIVWLFAMRILMVATSVFSYWINNAVSRSLFGMKDRFNFEIPLTSLVWMTSIISIAVTFVVSYLMLAESHGSLWWRLSTIISMGTLGAAIIPELTRVFTSAHSAHVAEIVDSGREGGASLTVLSGLVAGNFSAFWKGGCMVLLMFISYYAASHPDLTNLIPLAQNPNFSEIHAVFAFGLLAFGFLGMGPVTIAVDSYGPVTDNAQSVFELSMIEQQPGIEQDIQKTFGFKPDFHKGKAYLEENDSAGNTFKATAKPVLIGTAVIGATTMIFSIVLMLNIKLNLLDPHVLLGVILGGAVIYWFSGASMQAVTTGAFRAVTYIKENMRLDTNQAASAEASNEVVQICTRYAQAGMFNIFIVIFAFTISFAFFHPALFAAYLISIAVFGLYQALFMANAGGAWDNAKKVVEVELKMKGTPLHAATVVGDTVGDPFKDTSSVALNPVIKFTTLFGLLAAEIAAKKSDVGPAVGTIFLVIGLIFVWRSFYSMRIRSGGAVALKTAKA